MSIGKAKQCLEGYYRCRTIYSNELFDKMIPNTQDYLESKKFVITVAMPKLTPDLSRITVFKVSDPNGEATDAFSYELLVFMIAEIRIVKDLCLSNIIIIDLSDYGWKNMIKYTPTVNQKLVDMLMAVNLRIHSIHLINLTSVIDHLMRILKGILPNKIVNKIYIHKTHESLADQIPREYLPSTYGGTEKSLAELYDEWCKEIEDSEEHFRNLLNVKSTEKIELDPDHKSMFGCGVEGSFKQLAID